METGHLLYAIHAIHAMPHILKNPSTPTILQRRPQQPVSHAHQVLSRHRQHLHPRKGRQRAARNLEPRSPMSSDRGRRLVVAQIDMRSRSRDTLEYAGVGKEVVPDVVGDEIVAVGVSVAAVIGIAAEVGVAVALDERELDIAEGVDIVVEGGVGMPGTREARAVGVDEDQYRGEIGIIVDDVA